ncbi:MAG: HAD-IIIA family hydrolase [Candidatus Dormibacteraeota bacterium]|uniref:D,D-heptose 1,7-bisphosphate phosphatase n=1 Tax=Candidatus Dormiibacter inghamiae TaxID=3127013 RepID=A0A934KB84_9BACT|nr:HAD-IIIA family hydrolase [Candidatus Dormibacteraeota bacterium]MBJ7604754.1 HAD-IIIA family hydrolase [Candidatus Dormibacteraeota bacterium]
MTAPDFAVVVPTTGRPSLRRLLESLAAAGGPRPAQIIVVDDRPEPAAPLVVEQAGLPVKVLRSGGRGPAAARNTGWLAADAEWIAFLDDDLVCASDWLSGLECDLAGLGPEVAASQGRLSVPLTAGRRRTDWERQVAGLTAARWPTADMAFRRSALAQVGGFDERFRIAFREDSDLALRLIQAGFEIAQGRRQGIHPVPPAPPWISLGRQRGNAYDALMLARYGRGWRTLAGAPPGRRSRHAAITLAGLASPALWLTGRRRWAALAAATWAAGTAEFAWARIAPGPGSAAEVATMTVTSVLIPPLAVWHWLRGVLTLAPSAARPRLAVLLDRDGTLVDDVPYNGNPAAVSLRPGVRTALDRLRRQRVPLAVVSNQSGVGRGLLSERQVELVNQRIEQLAGPLQGWFVCPHSPEAGCACRKPQPGLILRAAARLGVAPADCVVIGDIGADVEAAAAAGARGILVPTPATLPEEVRAASEVAPHLGAAVDLVLARR